MSFLLNGSDFRAALLLYHADRGFPVLRSHFMLKISLYSACRLKQLGWPKEKTVSAGHE